MKAIFSLLCIILILGCTVDTSKNSEPKTLRFEKINYFKYPKGKQAKPFKYRLTYYFENKKPHRWIELDSLKKVTTAYIYEYDENWNHIGAKYREDGELDYNIEKVTGLAYQKYMEENICIPPKKIQ